MRRWRPTHGWSGCRTSLATCGSTGACASSGDFEETLLALFDEGLLNGTTHACIGQEADCVGVIEHLRDGDHIFSNHRCHGHYLARTGTRCGLLAEIMGKPEGVCGGIGGSQHLCAPGFKSNGIQGGIVPTAAGIALAMKLAGDRRGSASSSSATARSARASSTRR